MVQNKKQTRKVIETKSEGSTNKSDIEMKSEEDTKEESLQIEKLEHALNELNPFQKKCIELFYLKNMSYTQIVEMTGYSVNEVKSYIQNGKRNLKMIITNTK